MSDIGVYCRKEVLEHKRRDGKESDGFECYWEFAQLPNVEGADRFWFASEGRWQGFFMVKDVTDVLTFDSESWTSIDGGPRKPFQGFTYKVPKAGGKE
jgi:hypothetical protein